MNVSIIKHYDCHEIVNRLSTDCHAYPADCHHWALRFRVSHFKSDHFSRSSLQTRPFRGFWWVFAAYGWVLVGFRSLRLGFQISMLGFSTLRLGFQISMLGFTTLRLPFGKKNCFFRLGFLNKNQTNDFFLDFHKREGIVFIYLFLKNEDPAIPSWFLLIKPSRKKLFFCEKPAVRQ